MRNSAAVALPAGRSPVYIGRALLARIQQREKWRDSRSVDPGLRNRFEVRNLRQGAYAIIGHIQSLLPREDVAKADGRGGGAVKKGEETGREWKREAW